MKNKKAFEIQFNWLFVLIAGAAILIFFSVAVYKQKNIAETTTKATVLKSIEAIIIGASASTSTTTIVDVPDSKMEFSCNKISVEGVTKNYQSMILFSPNLLLGDKIVTQTLDFSVPFRATNLLYMTNPRVRYILIGDNSVAKEINKSLPSDIKKEFYSSIPPLLRNENNDKVKFIFFGALDETVLGKFERMQKSDVTAIKIDGTKEHGTVEFYEKNSGNWAFKGKSKYVHKSALIGAAYADDIEMFKCNMDNVFERLRIVAEIYLNRTRELRDSSSRQECRVIYGRALIGLTQLYIASGNFNEANIDIISEASNSLAIENKEAQKFSCALIY